ncbi:MAG: DUF4124 domain-containing protein [Zoogloeaceae bacterium]|jgi:hypothetical protein|nr:DUF4124 domain-containing protein [Zoogloeaceae bacterium]
MMMRFPVAALCACLLLAMPAWGQVYRCTDAEERVTITNVLIDKTNCKRMQIEADTTVPSPIDSSIRRPGAASRPTPPDFPTVSADEQNTRNNDRRAILNQELLDERQKLEGAKNQLATQEKVPPGMEDAERRATRLRPFRETIARHERNIEDLNRELGNLR